MRQLLFLSLTLVFTACAAAPATDAPSFAARPAQSRTSQEVTRQSIASQEERTPYADMMVYPANWAEVTRKRQ